MGFAVETGRHIFCTYFDLSYLARGLSLYRSLIGALSDFSLWVLCLDDECYVALKRAALPRVRLLSLAELETADTEFLGTKETRSRVEYYFTATPVLVGYLLERSPPGHLVTYLDADLFFFGSPVPLLRQLDQASCGLIEHRFPRNLDMLKKRNGIYNVGWVSLRNDTIGRACAARWRRQCLEWCYDRSEHGRFADQKYLDDVPSTFSRVAVLDHPGANLAPWNLGRHAVAHADGEILVDGKPLIFFHFHGLRQLSRRVHQAKFVNFFYRPSEVVVHEIYRPYVTALLREGRFIGALLSDRRGRMPRPAPRGRRFEPLWCAREVLMGDVLFVNGRPLRSVRRDGRIA